MIKEINQTKKAHIRSILQIMKDGAVTQSQIADKMQVSQQAVSFKLKQKNIRKVSVNTLLSLRMAAISIAKKNRRAINKQQSLVKA